MTGRTSFYRRFADALEAVHAQGGIPGYVDTLRKMADAEEAEMRRPKVTHDGNIVTLAFGKS
jgi:hypothetical protein